MPVRRFNTAPCADARIFVDQRLLMRIIAGSGRNGAAGDQCGRDINSTWGVIMKYLFPVAALAVLAACSAGEADAPAEAEAPAEAAVPMAADGQPTAGTYRVTNAEGATSTEVLLEDGTFTSTAADGTETTGTWEQKTPAIFCVTMNEEGAEQACYDEAVDEDGVWTSTNPEDGATSIVERIEEAGDDAAEGEAEASE